jgi:hypothetical protein
MAFDLFRLRGEQERFAIRDDLSHASPGPCSWPTRLTQCYSTPRKDLRAGSTSGINSVVTSAEYGTT